MVDSGIFVLLQGRELVCSYVNHRCDGALSARRCSVRRLLSQSLALMLTEVRFPANIPTFTSEAESGFDAPRNDVLQGLHA